MLRLSVDGCQGAKLGSETGDLAVFFGETCVVRRRVLELRTLGICGRLQPKLLKSRRREVWRIFPELSRTFFCTTWKKRAAVAERLALRFFVALAQSRRRLVLHFGEIAR
jgi:hypothetical protein